MAVKGRALALFCSAMVLLGCFFSFSEAANEVLVGGKAGAWKVPSSPSDSLELWSRHARFAVGDYLVLKYDGAKDSVLEVTKEAFLSCDTSNPIAEHKDGNTRVKLDRPGPFYFISGAEGHCKNGQKVRVVVVTPRKALAPAPAESPAESPATVPLTGSAPTSRATALGAFGVLCLGIFLI